MTWKMWLVCAAVSLVLEIIPPPTHFGLLCVSLGALGASIVAYFSPNPWLPWVVFVVATLALMPILIPLAKFLFSKRSAGDHTKA